MRGLGGNSVFLCATSSLTKVTTVLSRCETVRRWLCRRSGSTIWEPSSPRLPFGAAGGTSNVVVVVLDASSAAVLNVSSAAVLNVYSAAVLNASPVGGASSLWAINRIVTIWNTPIRFHSIASCSKSASH